MLTIDTFRDQISAHGLGTSLRQIHIEFINSLGVGVTGNFQRKIRVVEQYCGNPIQDHF